MHPARVADDAPCSCHPLVGQVMGYLEILRPGPQLPTPVHRLGVGTSGVLLCAKTKIARTRLSEALSKVPLTQHSGYLLIAQQGDLSSDVV